jgi:hypothetical protein
MFLFLTTLPCDVAEKLEQACIKQKLLTLGRVTTPELTSHGPSVARIRSVYCTGLRGAEDVARLGRTFGKRDDSVTCTTHSKRTRQLLVKNYHNGHRK